MESGKDQFMTDASPYYTKERKGQQVIDPKIRTNFKAKRRTNLKKVIRKRKEKRKERRNRESKMFGFALQSR